MATVLNTSRTIEDTPINLENYIYFYHTDTLLYLPFYPDSVNDSSQAKFSPSSPLGRSAPIQSYSGSGPRTIGFTMKMHREQLNYINYLGTGLNRNSAMDDDYASLLINEIQGCVMPSYAQAQKMVNPPIVAVRFGNNIFIKGIIQSAPITYEGPILHGNLYAMFSLNLTITELEPLDALMAMQMGSYRPINTSLEYQVVTEMSENGANGQGTGSGYDDGLGINGSRAHAAYGDLREIDPLMIENGYRVKLTHEMNQYELTPLYYIIHYNALVNCTPEDPGWIEALNADLDQLTKLEEGQARGYYYG